MTGCELRSSTSPVAYGQLTSVKSRSVQQFLSQYVQNIGCKSFDRSMYTSRQAQGNLLCTKTKSPSHSSHVKASKGPSPKL